MSQTIKRCPFCWSLNCRIEEANGWPCDSGKYVFCPECWETGPILPEDAADDEVVEAWNSLHDKLDHRDVEIKRLKKRISELEGKRG